jgi:RecA-family ATPase
MKKKLPIEEALEQKLQQIPQPDQETSWQAMKLLLEKDKRRPAFIFRRRNVIALLIILLSAALLLWKNNDRISFE